MGSPPSPKNGNNPVTSLMGSGSQRLNNLVQQLRLYKPPPSPADTDDDEASVDARGKVFSGMGLAESAVPPALHRPERFRPKRASVLVCLFEGDLGDLRVILTKRSSNLSSHSGSFRLQLKSPFLILI